MFAIGNDEINKLPEVITKGMIIEHQHPGGEWEEAVIKYGKELKTGKESDIMAFYTLKNGVTCLAGVAGKLLSRPNLRLKVDKPSSN